MRVFSMCQCAQVIVLGEDAAEHVYVLLRAGRECRSAGLVYLVIRAVSSCCIWRRDGAAFTVYNLNQDRGRALPSGRARVSRQSESARAVQGGGRDFAARAREGLVACCLRLCKPVWWWN